MNAILNHDACGCCRSFVPVTPEVRRTGKPRRERFSAALGSLSVIPRGYGGHPMSTACVQRARDTRAPLSVAIASQIPVSEPRIGRGLQISSFAGNAVMRPALRSCPVKPHFAGLHALFFIARNEGSSMVTSIHPCIHRIKWIIKCKTAKVRCLKRKRHFLKGTYKWENHQLGHNSLAFV